MCSYVQMRTQKRTQKFAVAFAFKNGYNAFMEMKETRNLEFKQDITNSFLKTVSAFANYGGGEIKFGVADDGTLVGIKNPKQVCLDIENKINDSIEPVPDYSLAISKDNVITLSVKEGYYKPYFYKSKAYRRNDSATIEVDRLELSRLILEGQNKNFEDLPSKEQDLSFLVLQEKLRKVLGIKKIDTDLLKTLELYDGESGYNNAAAILADKNLFCGIDIARFGESISVIFDRETFEKCSIIEQYEKSVNLFKKYYQYEEIKSFVRETKELIPETAFREALANALVHRTWDLNAHIKIALFPERIEISSPGGLPKEITREDYLRGHISILRNPIIGNVFFRLHYIERFGTGVLRINEAYKESDAKPIYEISENSIKITLPKIKFHTELTKDEDAIFAVLQNKTLSSSEIASLCGFGKTKVVALLKNMVSQGYVKTTGSGRGKKYLV